MTLKVGITGGIGSGKTTVCKYFEKLGIPVYYADEEAKKIMTKDPVVKKQLLEQFGKMVYLDNGELNKSFLRKRIFEDPISKKIIEEIVHPKVAENTQEWFQTYAHFPYALKEAALLIESGAYLELDKIIYVKAPKSLRIQWLMQRDNLTKDEINKRFKSQMPENKKIKYTDFIIENDGVKNLAQQVLNIDKILKSLSLSLTHSI